MATSTSNVHVPVLLNEVLEELQLNRPKNHIHKAFDGTLGGGGYTSALAKAGWKVFSCDLDQGAVTRYSQDPQLDSLPMKPTLVQANFADYIQTFAPMTFDAIVLDLGFSSNQLELESRGFSYKKVQDPLDLRYDEASGNPAWKKIYLLQSAAQLGKIIHQYGGEVLAFKIAQIIFESVHEKKGQACLVDDIIQPLQVYFDTQRVRKQAAVLSRVWQALRIWTNNEFDHLVTFLEYAPAKLAIGGRLAIVNFHSLEDKLTTRFFRDISKPISEDEYGNKAYQYELRTKKPIVPSESEVRTNPRSRSATLRVLERLQ